jgi:hypothetical protein
MREKLMVGGALVGLVCGGLCGGAFGYIPAESGERMQQITSSHRFDIRPTYGLRPFSRGASVSPIPLTLGILGGAAIGFLVGRSIADSKKSDAART